MGVDLSKMTQPTTSPFDQIRRFRPDGTEYWTARDMMEPLGYEQWRRMSDAVERAKASCKAMGHNVSDHFAVAGKPIVGGKGAVQVVADYHLTRYACSLVAMNGDPRKPKVAAAQQYFTIQTRRAELMDAQGQAAEIDRAWSKRLEASVEPHLSYVNIHHPGCFTVVTAAVAEILILETQCVRHMFRVTQSDRPDVSMGRHWATARRNEGLEDAIKTAPLLLPDTGLLVGLRVYDESEHGSFKRWLLGPYMREKLWQYIRGKESFRTYDELARASVAENTCQKLTGKPVLVMKPKIRRQLADAKGFWPAGRDMAQLPSPQRTLFDLSQPAA